MLWNGLWKHEWLFPTTTIYTSNWQLVSNKRRGISIQLLLSQHNHRLNGEGIAKFLQRATLVGDVLVPENGFVKSMLEFQKGVLSRTDANRTGLEVTKRMGKREDGHGKLQDTVERLLWNVLGIVEVLEPESHSISEESSTATTTRREITELHDEGQLKSWWIWFMIWYF